MSDTSDPQIDQREPLPETRARLVGLLDSVMNAEPDRTFEEHMQIVYSYWSDQITLTDDLINDLQIYHETHNFLLLQQVGDFFQDTITLAILQNMLSHANGGSPSLISLSLLEQAFRVMMGDDTELHTFIPGPPPLPNEFISVIIHFFEPDIHAHALRLYTATPDLNVDTARTYMRRQFGIPDEWDYFFRRDCNQIVIGVQSQVRESIKLGGPRYRILNMRTGAWEPLESTYAVSTWYNSASGQIEPLPMLK